MRLVFILLIALTSHGLSAQKTWDDILTNLETASTDYINAFIGQDWDTYMAHTHKNVVEMAGGKEVLIPIAQETFKMYESIGFSMKEASITGKIETVDSPEGIQALIPAAIVMSSNGEDVNTPMKLFALSTDAGDTWTFVDLSQYDASNIKVFVPEFSEKLIPLW